MRIILIALALFVGASVSQAADLANGKAINKSCALCHGALGQGTPGRLSPRLAGLNKDYLVKALGEYKNGSRPNPVMVKTSSINEMSDSDFEDVSAYLAAIDLSPDEQFNVKQTTGDPKAGKKNFNRECKSCHAKDGYGKPKKGAPALAGQHYEYLFTTIKLFQQKTRIHDDDPEDETFDDFSDQEILDITAYLVTLDDGKVVANGKAILPEVDAVVRAETEKATSDGLQITDITQTVARMNLEKGVSIEDALEAMRSKAVELNMRLVGEQHVSKELENRGVESPYLSILQFCDPMDARTMIVANPIFASYMPCRIAVVEDQNKAPSLMMLNLDMLINNKLLPANVIETAIKVNQNMLDIMVAGATGEF